MKTRAPIVSILLSLTLSSYPACADENLAPFDSIVISDEVMAQIPTQNATVRKAKRKNLGRCDIAVFGRWSCAPRLALPRELARDDVKCGSFYTFSWYPQEALPRTASHVDRLKVLAKNFSVFACEENSCLTIAPLQISRSAAGASASNILGVCSVQNIQGTFGPPHDCKPIYHDNGSKKNVVAIVGTSATACRMGLPDFNLVFYGRRELEKFSIQEKILAVLTSPPFDLKSIAGDGSVVGSRAYLPSQVFPPDREWVTVRVDFQTLQPRVNGVSAVGVTISTTILVNRQNTVSRVDWTAASEQQERTYTDTLRAKLGAVRNVVGIGVAQAPRI
jgi:hypothetical protein